jgi:hypothetical protein
MRTLPLSSHSLRAALLAIATLAAGSTLLGCAGDDTNPPAPPAADSGPGDASKSSEGGATDSGSADSSSAADSSPATDSGGQADTSTETDSGSAADSAGE